MLSETLDKVYNQKKSQLVLVVDGTNQLIRAWAIHQKYNKQLYGIFLSEISTIISRFRPSKCILVFDGQGGNFVRQKIYPQYKANRSSIVKLHTQRFQQLFSILVHTPIISLRLNHVQGDDIIAHLAMSNANMGNRVIIASGDQDFYQLCSDMVQVWSPIKKILVNVSDVQTMFGCHPINMPIYKALLGDKSDNIPGIRGVGPKTIIKHLSSLLQQQDPIYGQLQNLKQTLQNMQFSDFKIKLLNQFDNIKTFFKIVNLRGGCVISPQIGSSINGYVDNSINDFNRNKFVEVCNKFKILSEIQSKIVPTFYMMRRK